MARGVTGWVIIPRNRSGTGCCLRKTTRQRLNAMLELGQSQPWQEALFTLTGSRKMDATAMLEYFAPLKAWLDEQNKGKPVGW